jgi:hypothetical protein
MPLIRPRRNPMKAPPKAPIQLGTKQTMMSDPHIAWLFRFEYNMTALMIIRTPHRVTRRPKIPPKPPRKKVRVQPMAPVARPVSRTNIPPMKKRTSAVVDFSVSPGNRHYFVWDHIRPEVLFNLKRQSTWPSHLGPLRS